MEKFVKIVLERFKDSNTADNPSSFFPIEQEYSDDLLQVLTGELDLLNLIQSDPVLVSTFHELVQKSFSAEVESVNFLDTLLSFDSWISKMIFKNLANLLTAITKKRRVGDTSNGIQKKRKSNSSSAAVLSYKDVCGLLHERNAAKAAASSTTTSTVPALVAPDKMDKVSMRVRIPYKNSNAKKVH
jgi:hypothetical protein